MDQKVLKCVYAALDEVNEDRLDLPPLEKSPDTRFHGGDGALDSLGLIYFLVAVEEGVEREYGVEIALSEGESLSEAPSSFGTVQGLVEHVEAALDERSG